MTHTVSHSKLRRAQSFTCRLQRFVMEQSTIPTNTITLTLNFRGRARLNPKRLSRKVSPPLTNGPTPLLELYDEKNMDARGYCRSSFGYQRLHEP